MPIAAAASSSCRMASHASPSGTRVQPGKADRQRHEGEHERRRGALHAAQAAHPAGIVADRKGGPHDLAEAEGRHGEVEMEKRSTGRPISTPITNAPTAPHSTAVMSPQPKFTVRIDAV